MPFHALSEYRGRHAGKTILVFGCGASAAKVVVPEGCITIGVNDLGRLFDPDYLVVLNTRQQFHGDRFRFVEESRASAVFSQLELGIQHPQQVQFKLGKRGGTDLSCPDTLPHTSNSPYVALCLAAYMGASRIGLVGVDFTDHHFFAQTGKHALNKKLAMIDREYEALYRSLTAAGVEIRNLSYESLLRAIPKVKPEEFFGLPPRKSVSTKQRSVFFVGYKFLSCGTVFDDGLGRAADELGLRWENATWDDPLLTQKVEAFHPDLLFVIHGRNFSDRHPGLVKRYPSAVWLLDEPYEVDSTAEFSKLYDHVFCNDSNSLHRHRKAHYLPVCFDPIAHMCDAGDERTYSTGFVGGANPKREQALLELAKKGLLSYVVGGPWRSAQLNQLSLSGNLSAADTARLYRKTKLVLNVFRTRHHFNREEIAAVSMNPRIYEALACGALVVSEYRPELETVFPELPTFRSPEEMMRLVRRHTEDPHAFESARERSMQRLAGHTYANRLRSVLEITSEEEFPMPRHRVVNPSEDVSAEMALPSEPLLVYVAESFDGDAGCATAGCDGEVLLRPSGLPRAGSERGLVGKARYEDVAISFELYLAPGTQFLAKLRQSEAHDQLTNSYHFACNGAEAYLGRHDHVFGRFRVPVGQWFPVEFACQGGQIEVHVEQKPVVRIADQRLHTGFCFLGVKAGEARLRGVKVTPLHGEDSSVQEYKRLRPAVAKAAPMVSIVTTVYDRVECLEMCIRSVQRLLLRDYEQIIVVDAADAPVMRKIAKLVKQYDPDGKTITLATLKRRQNDWGISPAAAGLAMAKGKYLCFLSDDNGYLPHHFDRLLSSLESDRSIGFAYSSCLYNGRRILNSPIPRASRIDLGQPLFRRELFDRHLGGVLPFNEHSWDWRLIESFLRKGVRWKHINAATFVFRLASYPQLIPATMNVAERVDA